MISKQIQILLILVALFSFEIVSAQVAGNILYHENTRWKFQNQSEIVRAQQPSNEVTFEINAIYNAQADSYLAIFHITQVGSDAIEADSLMNNRLYSFQDKLLPLGIKDEMFIIDMLSMVPVYDIAVEKKVFSKTYSQVPAGFEIKKNVHVHFKNAQDLDQIITAAAVSEIYDLIKVDYYVKNVDEIYAELRAKATAMILEKEAQFEELGIPIETQWKMASDKVGVFFPLDRYTSYQPVSRTNVKTISKKRKEIIDPAPVQTSPTIFYNKIPYTNYDIIIQPEIVEPAVQYTYNLQVRYFVEKEKEEEPKEVTVTEHKYLLLTDKGDFKELKIKP